MFTSTLLQMFVAPLLAMMVGWTLDRMADRTVIDEGQSRRPRAKARNRPTLRFDAVGPGPSGPGLALRIARRA